LPQIGFHEKNMAEKLNRTSEKMLHAYAESELKNWEVFVLCSLSISRSTNDDKMVSLRFSECTEDIFVVLWMCCTKRRMIRSIARIYGYIFVGNERERFSKMTEIARDDCIERFWQIRNDSFTMTRR